jgi:hypothetical protein
MRLDSECLRDLLTKRCQLLQAIINPGAKFLSLLLYDHDLFSGLLELIQSEIRLSLNLVQMLILGVLSTIE